MPNYPTKTPKYTDFAPKSFWQQAYLITPELDKVEYKKLNQELKCSNCAIIPTHPAN